MRCGSGIFWGQLKLNSCGNQREITELVKRQGHTADHIIYSHRRSGRMNDERQARWLSGTDEESGAAARACTDDSDIAACRLQIFRIQVNVLPELNISLPGN